MRSSTIFAVFFVFAFAVFLTFSKIGPTEPSVSVEVADGENKLPGLPSAGTQSSSTKPTQSEVKTPPPFVVASNVISTTTDKNTTPFEVRGIYLTACVAGSSARRSQIISMMEELDLNAVIIDIKDYSGFVSYKMPSVPEVAASGADSRTCIKNIETVLDDFRASNIYTIGRITVFQDPVFAATHPELALKNNTNGALWRDNKGLEWLDPASESVWVYTESIAKDALVRGFDEINFDYIRFPSDGPMSLIQYPFYDGLESRQSVISRFFAHLRNSLSGKVISADLFGLTVSTFDDLGIGQTLYSAFPYFDYIAPMVYPSHFASGYKGFVDPAAEPYGVIRNSMQDGLLKRQVFMQKNPGVKAAKFRPWLQAFNLGAVYDKEKIDAQVRGVQDTFLHFSDSVNGWMFWDPNNTYSSFY